MNCQNLFFAFLALAMQPDLAAQPEYDHKINLQLMDIIASDDSSQFEAKILSDQDKFRIYFRDDSQFANIKFEIGGIEPVFLHKLSPTISYIDLAGKNEHNIFVRDTCKRTFGLLGSFRAKPELRFLHFDIVRSIGMKLPDDDAPILSAGSNFDSSSNIYALNWIARDSLKLTWLDSSILLPDIESLSSKEIDIPFVAFDSSGIRNFTVHQRRVGTAPWLSQKFSGPANDSLYSVPIHVPIRKEPQYLEFYAVAEDWHCNKSRYPPKDGTYVTVKVDFKADENDGDNGTKGEDKWKKILEKAGISTAIIGVVFGLSELINRPKEPPIPPIDPIPPPF